MFKHIHPLFIIGVVLGAGRCAAQSIPADRITDWSEPGARPAFIPEQSVSILSFGADPTGASSSSAALQSAITALGGPGEILFPAGQYRLTQSIALPDSIILQGEAGTDQ